MTTSRELWDRLRNGGPLVAQRILALGLTLIVGIALARRVGAESYGAYAAGAAFATVSFSPGPFGSDQLYLLGRLNYYQARRRAGAAGLLLALVTCGLAVAWPSLPATARLCALALAGAGAAQAPLLIWFAEPARFLDFPARARRERLLLIVTMVARTASLIASRSVVLFSASTAVASAGLLAYSMMRRPKAHREVRAAAPTSTQSSSLRHGLAFSASSVFYTAYFQIDVVILAALQGSNAAGQYRVAVNALSALVVLAVVLNNDILRPTLITRRGAEFLQSARRGLRLSLVIGAVASLALAIPARWLIPIIYGQAYNPAVPLVTILACGLLAHFYSSWAGNALIAAGAVSRVLVIQGVMLAINLIANLIVLQNHGAIAAAWTTVATETVGALLYLVMARFRVLRSLVKDRDELEKVQGPGDSDSPGGDPLTTLEAQAELHVNDTDFTVPGLGISGP